MLYSYLYIARANDPPIVRYNPVDKDIVNFNYDGVAQSISVDQFNNVIYWVNYDADKDSHTVMKTLQNKDTFPLNITYNGEIDLTSDVLYLYVLDKENNVIDKYLKTSLEKQGNITFNGTINDLIIAYGELPCRGTLLMSFPNYFFPLF